MGGAMSSGLQSAMSNPMFYLGAQSLMQTPSVGRPAPNPFSMQNILAAQQMADAQKQRQFLPNLLAEKEAYDQYLTDRKGIDSDYLSNIENLTEPYTPSFLEADYLADIEALGPVPTDPQQYDQYKLKRKDVDNLYGEIVQDEMAEQAPLSALKSNLYGLQREEALEALGPAPTNPLAPANIMESMLTSGIPAYHNMYLQRLMTPSTPFTIPEGSTVLMQDAFGGLSPLKDSSGQIISGRPKMSNLEREMRYVQELNPDMRREEVAKLAMRSMGPTTFNQAPSAFETASAKSFGQTRDAAEGAKSVLNTVSMMGEALMNPDFDTNKLEGLRNKGRAFAFALTGDPVMGERVAQAETFNAMGTELLRLSLNAATGPQTDRDAAVLQQGLPSEGKTKRANEILVDMIKGTNYRIIEKEQFISNYMNDKVQNEGRRRDATLYEEALGKYRKQEDYGLFQENPNFDKNHPRNKTARRLQKHRAYLQGKENTIAIDPNIKVLPTEIPATNTPAVEEWGRANGVQEGESIRVGNEVFTMSYTK